MDPQIITEIAFDQHSSHPSVHDIRVHPVSSSPASQRLVQCLWYERPNNCGRKDSRDQSITKESTDASTGDLSKPIQEWLGCCSSAVQAFSIFWCFKSFFSEVDEFTWSISAEILDYLCCACLR
ncbi:hypothetical protein TCAL_15867, partial [Tigriopus californicus]